MNEEKGGRQLLNATQDAIATPIRKGIYSYNSLKMLKSDTSFRVETVAKSMASSWNSHTTEKIEGNKLSVRNHNVHESELSEEWEQRGGDCIATGV